MSEFRKRWSFSFAIGLALGTVCLAYIWQWQSYAPRMGDVAPNSPYLTPWAVLSVAILSLSLAVISMPVRNSSPIQIIASKALSVAVVCFSTVFLLEYISGIRVPDLDLFFLPDATGHRVTLYSARPSAHSATTSLLFALALLFYDRDAVWRRRVFQVGTLAALVLPTFSALGYLVRFFAGTRQPGWLISGLSIPAIILYFTLGSGFLGLSHLPRQTQSAIPRPGKAFRRWV